MLIVYCPITEGASIVFSGSITRQCNRNQMPRIYATMAMLQADGRYLEVTAVACGKFRLPERH